MKREDKASEKWRPDGHPAKLMVCHTTNSATNSSAGRRKATMQNATSASKFLHAAGLR
eukprot:CAMPEP_0179142678 /NCGR_PEP_ID=MMETSP0796-20121207/68546_1 /TAXON_ID=73915 /ORGANISM="Pyrodinium bahamense, Strain pbaha01" /LENGTH=57 /DNA_ID=CAMNT_0020842581 /DNA_START=40 /DNA_END=209 /DNA_ORIENTATION=+